MIVVCDATPLIHLHWIGTLDLLRQLYGSVLVSDGVMAEANHHGMPTELPGVVVRTAVPASGRFPWLDQGEREAIDLAMTLMDPLLIIDDSAGRRAADALGLTTIGTGRVLISAKRAGLVPLVQPLLDRMRSNGWRCTPAVQERILALAGE